MICRTAWKAACFVSAAMVWSGCAGLTESLNKQLLDYATTDEGATVTVSGSSGGRSGKSLINGVADPSLWAKGEGWEHTWERGGRQRQNRGQQERGIEGMIERGAVSAHIRLKEPKFINRIVIHEMDSPDLPAAGIESGLIQIYDSSSGLNPWKTAAQIQSGWVVVYGRQSFEVKPVTKIPIKQVKTDQVRVIIATMKERTRAASDGSREQGVRMTIRLLEIEVTGSDAAPTEPPEGVAQR